MAEAVDHSIRTGEHLAVQAGTGTGKSLAYLVPSIRHAVAEDETVVVSTATIALQRQLVDRDLPRLSKALKKDLGREPTFAILKGRRNYLCMHRVHNGAPDEPELREQDERDANPVDGRDDHVARVGHPQGCENGREVAAVAADPLDEPASDAIGEPRPQGQRPALEVVADPHASGGHFVEPEEPIALDRAGRRGQRRSPCRSVRVGKEDSGRTDRAIVRAHLASPR